MGIYPTKIEANGNIYNINTDYRYALQCFNVINNPQISDIERYYALMVILIKESVLKSDEAVVMAKIGNYLRCGEDNNESEDNIDMDYEEDENIIRTSIRQCYHINIDKEDMHWWEYNDLIAGLTEETLLTKTRELRSFDLSTINDIKMREKVAKAQERVALKRHKVFPTEEQQKNEDEFYRLIGKTREEVKK